MINSPTISYKTSGERAPVDNGRLPFLARGAVSVVPENELKTVSFCFFSSIARGGSP